MTTRKPSQKYESLKPEFMKGTLTLREFADVHGVSYDGLRQTAATGKWVEERHKLAQQVTAEANKLNLSNRVTELAKFNEDDLKVAKLIRGMVIKRINDGVKSPKGVPTAELKTLSSIVVDAQKIARLALGANTESHELTGHAGLPMQVSNVPVEEYRQALREVLGKY